MGMQPPPRAGAAPAHPYLLTTSLTCPFPGDADPGRSFFAVPKPVSGNPSVKYGSSSSSLQGQPRGVTRVGTEGLPPLSCPPPPPRSQPVLVGVQLGVSTLVSRWGAVLQVAPRLQVPQHQATSHVLVGFLQELLEEPEAGQADLRHGETWGETPPALPMCPHPRMELTSSERWLQRLMSWVRSGWEGSPGVSGCRSGPRRKKTRRWSRGGARICRTVPVSTAVALRTSSSDLLGTGWDVLRGKRRYKQRGLCSPGPKGVPDRETPRWSLPPASDTHICRSCGCRMPWKNFSSTFSAMASATTWWVTAEAEPGHVPGAAPALGGRPGAPYRVGTHHQLIEVVQPAEEGSQVLLTQENPIAASITLRPARGR